ncbi:hypothetical protein OR16_04617 [Cupriavidus basilensis OR16]|uniref:Uncharacterized protein n=1 Tax=Cupriavidus basilensis OR16 TaxID=1127483 RepID=H1S015_9BURK|nr:hypothetical protein [Cupriavidus basilensis]EHP44231.1 hypothetical protein OR16_04617 [Cupriavidus basilensis OR16]
MQAFEFLGYRIEPAAAYHDDIRRWIPAGVIRNSGISDGATVPVSSPEFYFNEAEACSACAARARAMIRAHRAGDESLIDLVREQQWWRSGNQERGKP